MLLTVIIPYRYRLNYRKIDTLVIRTISLIRYTSISPVAHGVRIIEVACTTHYRHRYRKIPIYHIIMTHSLLIKLTTTTLYGWWNTSSSEVRQLGHIQPLVAYLAPIHFTAPTTCTETELESLWHWGLVSLLQHYTTGEGN